MQCAGQHFLAGAALAQQHHARAARCHLLDRSADAQHGRVTGDQPGRIGDLGFPQPAVFGLQLCQLERAPKGQLEELRLKRLGEEVVGAQCDRTQRIGALVLTCQHDDLGVGCRRQNLREQPKSLGYRVRIRGQTQVHGDDCRHVPAQLHQRTLPIVGHHSVEPVQRPFDLRLQAEVILDNQHAARLAHSHAATRTEASACLGN